MFEPVALRLHPLTRIVSRQDNHLRIDAHIELRDAAGDEVKGAGLLVIELVRGGGPIMTGGSSPYVLRWQTDLSDPAENNRSYDRVTRTYRFELSGETEIVAAGNLRLRAALTRSDGRALTDELTLDR